MESGNGTSITKGRCIPLDSIDRDRTAADAGVCCEGGADDDCEILLYPSWTIRGIFDRGPTTEDTVDSTRRRRRRRRLRRRRLREGEEEGGTAADASTREGRGGRHDDDGIDDRDGDGDGDGGSGGHRTRRTTTGTTTMHAARRWMIDEVRNCDYCATALLWTPIDELRHFPPRRQSSSYHDGGDDDDSYRDVDDNDDASGGSPPRTSVAERLPGFVERHVGRRLVPVPCGYCTADGAGTGTDREERGQCRRRWCGSLYCGTECRMRGEAGARWSRPTSVSRDDASSTITDGGMTIASSSSGGASFPRLLHPKLFFCRNRFSGDDLDSLTEVVDSLLAIEGRFKRMCGCKEEDDDDDADESAEVIGVEECALLITTIAACIHPDWMRERFASSTNGNRGIFSSGNLNSDEEGLVEELWAMSRSYSSVSELLRKCNDTSCSSSFSGVESFPSYAEFLWLYLDTKRNCLLRVNLATHPVLSYVTKTLLSPSRLSENEQGLALDLLMPLGSFLDSDNWTKCDDESAVSDRGVDQSSILRWRNAAHLAHRLSSPADMDESQSRQIRTHLRKSYFVYSPHAFRRMPHSCVPTLELTVEDPSRVGEDDYRRSPLKSLTWLALHDIPCATGRVFTISKLGSVEGGFRTRQAELKQLMGQDFVCSCPRCRVEAREKDVEVHVSEIQLKNIADLAMQHGRFEDASTLYDEILRSHPRDGDVLHARAASYLGRASTTSFANYGHCRGYYIKAQSLWEQAGSIEECSTHPGIATHVKKLSVYRTLPYFEASLADDTSINNCIDFTTYLDGKCFVTNKERIVSFEECADLINTAENHADGWTTSRHYAVPTTDIPLHELTKIHSWFYQLWNERIRPLLRRQFQITPGKGCITTSNKTQRDIFLHDCFIVRYDAKRQRYLPPHLDESTISFIIPLNSDFKGGGTFIHSLGRTVSPATGGMMSFCGGDLLHSGDPVVLGVRYIIAAFCYVDLVDGGAAKCVGDQIIPNLENDPKPRSRKKSKLNELLTGDVDKATVSQTFSFGFEL